MFKVAIRPQWDLRHPDGRQLMPRLIELLVAVDECRQLAAACARVDLSYRYAWGLLKEAERDFGAPLLETVRGRGTKLSPLGEKLVWADRRVAARLSPFLDSLASELEVEVERALSEARPILRVQATHGFAVETMRRFLVEEGVPLDLKYRSSGEVLSALHAGGCDLAGLHVSQGELQEKVIARYASALDPSRQHVIDLATRRQGLIVAPDNPKRILHVRDLSRPGVRFVNREPESGTRLILDLLLQAEGIKGEGILGYDEIEFTHAAVAAYVASGMADVGLGLETPARRFSLGFVPVVTERYFFLCDEDTLDSPRVQHVLGLMKSDAFKASVGSLPGYDASRSGMVQPVGEAFPSLLKR